VCDERKKGMVSTEVLKSSWPLRVTPRPFSNLTSVIRKLFSLSNKNTNTMNRSISALLLFVLSILCIRHRRGKFDLYLD
jgi:hypothetical protein